MVLTKQRIAQQLQPDLGITKQQAAVTIKSLLDLIKVPLKSGKDALASVLGKSCVKEKRGRNGRNPSTGGKMMMGPQHVVTFNCSGQLQAKINTR